MVRQAHHDSRVIFIILWTGYRHESSIWNRMDKRKLSELLVEHKEKSIGDHAFTPREILAQAADMARQKEIHVITGVRRSGKSTLMRLIARYLIQEENVPRENILYLNFEDDRFAEFKTLDFQTLYESYLEFESRSSRKLRICSYSIITVNKFPWNRKYC